MKNVTGIRDFNKPHEFFEMLSPCKGISNVPGWFWPLAEIHFAGNLAWHESLIEMKALIMHAIHHRYAEIDGQRLFYREAGPADAAALVLLHGFPASSFMFRNL